MYDAIVLAGGAARRLGGRDKPAVELGGTTLLDRVVAAVPEAAQVVVVGPRREVARDVVWCRESPPGGGPVPAVAAGLGYTSADLVLVLAADLPFLAPAVAGLVAAAGAAPAAFLVDPAGRVNYLAGAWRRPALTAALERLESRDGASMRALVAHTAWEPVADEAGWGRDCDTWDDLAAAREAVR